MENPNKPGYQNNATKLELLLDNWYKKTFGENYEESSSYSAFQTKINLARNDVVEALEDPTEEDYLQLVDKKAREPISAEVFTVPASKESLDLIFYCSTNYYDLSNPQKGITSGNDLANIRDQFARCNPNGAVKVIIGGNNLGEEWQFKHYKDSKIIDNRGQFHGLIERKERLIKDIKRYLSVAKEMGFPDVEIYLIKGYQEHIIKQKLCVDVFDDVVKELNLPNVHYIREGISPYVTCVRELEDGTVIHSDIKLLTNMRNKGKSAKSEASSVERYNGQNNGTTTFVLNGNVFGKLNHREEYHVTGQAEYLRTSKGNKPDRSPKGYDVFSVYLSRNETIVVEGAGNLFSNNVGAELALDYQEKKTDMLIDAIYTEVHKKLKVRKPRK
ncbi:MAG: hypothetical protein IKJ30_06095 [Bacilli bacterium]|nr:hypothetical protein [Bacilli bacterium]